VEELMNFDLDVPVSGTKCLVTPQFQALPEVGSPSSDAILHVNSSIVVLRITPDGKHIVAYVRDKNTLALLDDRYFVFDMMAYSTSDPPKVVGVFSGFTSDIRLVRLNKHNSGSGKAQSLVVNRALGWKPISS
jgi:hypothetical protein